MRAVAALMVLACGIAAAQSTQVPDHDKFVAGWAQRGVFPPESEVALLIWQAKNAACDADVRSRECQTLAELHEYKLRQMRQSAAEFAEVQKRAEKR